MIQTNVSFTTTDKKLDRLYESAKNLLLSSVTSFGDRSLMTDAPNGDTVTLNYSLMSSETLADYDLASAFDTVNAFLVTLRKDGRLASSLAKENGARAFAYSGVKKIYIPDTVTEIAEDAFEGADKVVICSRPSSYAQEYAEEYGLNWEDDGQYYFDEIKEMGF